MDGRLPLGLIINIPRCLGLSCSLPRPCSAPGSSSLLEVTHFLAEDADIPAASVGPVVPIFCHGVRGESFSLLLLQPQPNLNSFRSLGFAFFKALPLLFDPVTALVWIKSIFHHNSLIRGVTVLPAASSALWCPHSSPCPGTTEMAPGWKSRKDQQLWPSSSHQEGPG